jgi:hypothetical protein
MQDLSEHDVIINHFSEFEKLKLLIQIRNNTIKLSEFVFEIHKNYNTMKKNINCISYYHYSIYNEVQIKNTTSKSEVDN